jgi:hypothetical protein
MSEVAIEASELSTKEWKSPAYKLVDFFFDSRNRWKTKCKQLKRERKRMQNQVRAVEKSRENWAVRAAQAELRVRELEKEVENLKRRA